MADLDHENGNDIILDLAEDAVIIDAIAPEFAKITLQALTEASRIFVPFDARLEERNDTPCWVVTELTQLLKGLCGEAIVPVRAQLLQRYRFVQGSSICQRQGNSPRGLRDVAQ